jgi:xanthine dehydrogenase small subunit
VSDSIRFWLDDRLVDERTVPPTTTLLRYLRDHVGQCGTKEGCAEGDCGACTVAILEPRTDGGGTFRAVNSCLIFLPMLQGKRVYTVEALRDRGAAMRDASSGYHPAQQAMVTTRGSQCGYCTPGIVMSLFEACYRDDMGADWQIDDQLCGNLCRCTGYRPIREAAEAVAGSRPADRFAAEARQYTPGDAALTYASAHPIHGPQRYLQPTTDEELFRLVAEHPDAKLVAGGTDLGLEVTKHHKVLPLVIGLEGIEGLRALSDDGEAFTVGAGVTLTRLLEAVDGQLPSLEKMLRVFGSRQVRSRATIGGNLATCSPIGDLAPVLVSLQAEATVRSAAGSRTLPMGDFLAGYRQADLRPGEVLWSIRIPRATGFARSYKVSKRREMDISTASAGMQLWLADDGTVAELVLSYGGLSARPAQRATHTEAALRGQPWSLASLQAALPELQRDYQPISDLRGSAAYRNLLARNLLIGFFHDSQRADRDVLEDLPVATVSAGVPHA